MTGTNSNYNPEQWAAHLEQQRQAQLRVTPILKRQAENAPKSN